MWSVLKRSRAILVGALGLSAGVAMADDEPAVLTPVPENAEESKPAAEGAPAAAPAGATVKPAASTPATPAAEPVSGSAAAEDGAQGEDGKPRALGASPPPTGRNAVGIALGLSSGMGVSYRRYVTEHLAVRGEGGILAGKDWKIFSLGLGVQEDFLRAFYYRLYAVQTFALHSGSAESLLLVPGIGLGYEHNFTGLRKGWAVRGELVLSPVIEVGNQNGIEANRGLLLVTPLPQIGGSYVF